MTSAIAITVGTLGIVATVIGIFMYVLFRFVTAQFDHVLEVQFASQRTAHVAPRIWKISNPLIRNIARKHLSAAHDVLGIATTRCALQSRQHQGLVAVAAGVLLTVCAIYTRSWLPLIWGPI